MTQCGMEFATVVHRRHMVRRYQPDRPVSRDVIDKLLILATRAPSAGFTQGWSFLVLDERAVVDAFWACTTGPQDGTTTSGDGTSDDAWLTGMRTAPCLILVLSDKSSYMRRYAEPDKGWTDRSERHWPVPYWDVDAGMAALLMLLGAVDAGLGACFFGVPGERWAALREVFDVSQHFRPVGVVSLGYAASDRRSPSLRRGRRPLADVVRYGSFAG